MVIGVKYRLDGDRPKEVELTLRRESSGRVVVQANGWVFAQFCEDGRVLVWHNNQFVDSGKNCCALL